MVSHHIDVANQSSCFRIIQLFVLCSSETLPASPFPQIPLYKYSFYCGCGFIWENYTTDGFNRPRCSFSVIRTKLVAVPFWQKETEYFQTRKCSLVRIHVIPTLLILVRALLGFHLTQLLLRSVIYVKRDDTKVWTLPHGRKRNGPNMPKRAYRLMCVLMLFGQCVCFEKLPRLMGQICSDAALIIFVLLRLWFYLESNSCGGLDSN